MGASAGDLIQCVDNQIYLGQQVLNVYYYRVTDPLGIADPYLNLFNAAFSDTVLTAVRGIQIGQVSHVSREWKNLSNGVDLYVDGTVLDGTHTAPDSEMLPSFISAGFILRR